MSLSASPAQVRLVATSNSLGPLRTERRAWRDSHRAVEELGGAPRITRRNEVAFFARLLHYGETRCFPHQESVGLLMTGDHYESLRVRTNILILVTRESDDVRAARVLALAEVGRPLTVNAELVCFRPEVLVGVPEDDQSLYGSRDRAAHCSASG